MRVRAHEAWDPKHPFVGPTYKIMWESDATLAPLHFFIYLGTHNHNVNFLDLNTLPSTNIFFSTIFGLLTS